MSDNRKITASCLLKVNGSAVRVQLSPAAIYGGQEGHYRVRVNRIWRNGHDGNPLFVDRASLGLLLADLMCAAPAQAIACPNLPSDARVNVTVWQDDEPHQLAGWTYSTPIRADDGLWYVVVSAGGSRFFARCDDVRLLPPAAQPGGRAEAAMPVIDFSTGQPVKRRVEAPIKEPPAKAQPARRKRGTAAHEMRKALLAKVHIAKTQLGMTDDEYLTLLDSYYNVASAGVLGLTELKGLVLVMQREYGFKPTKGSAKRKAARKKAIPAPLQPEADDPLATKQLLEKIEAQLTEKGRVEGTHVPWGYAVAVLKKQSGGVTRCFEHATAEQLRGVISALTRDAKRKGRRAY